MSIQGIHDHGIYESPLKAHEAQRKEPVPAAAPEILPDKISESPAYEVVPGENPEPAGLYKMAHDDAGNPIIEFDDPQKSASSSMPEPMKADPADRDEPKEKSGTCTINTDKVDREIKKLKSDQKQLEQQIRSINDPAKAKDLEQQLAQIENELRQKDNDGYRRQNATVTYT